MTEGEGQPDLSSCPYPKWLMMVSGIAHHYVMLIQGSNRQRFRIPGNFTALPPDYRPM